VEATKLMDQFNIERGMRADLYKIVKEASTVLPPSLDSESRRLVEKMLIDFKLNGLELVPEKQSQLKKLKGRIAEVEVEFSNNMNEDNTTMTFSKEDLEGCAAAFLEGLGKAEDGKYILTMKYPDVFGVLRNAVKESTRRAIGIAFDARCPQNAALISEAVKLRQEAALLLGYEEHAEVRLVTKMAQYPSRVRKFLADLRPRLGRLAKSELTILSDLKRTASKDNSVSQVMSFDFSFLHRQLMQQKYSVDHEKLREYFPLEHVLSEMMALYEGLLDIRFVRVEPSERTRHTLWHEDVQLYEVQDGRTSEPLGHIFFDLFPRDGKYTHAACFQLQPGFADTTSRQLPACALVCNFNKATLSRPSLLGHDEVVTLFHELGHGMHDMCAKVTYARFHGTNVEYDFVEAPSQMLENWCWESEVLAKLSRHFETREPLSPELIAALVSTKNVNTGLTHLRQLFFATLDMHIHSKELKAGEDLNKLYGTMRGDITLINQPTESTPLCSFGHLMGGCISLPFPQSI
jgi:Zn-dependent oligopeptidase